MNAIRLGDPNIFVKGVVEQVLYDPQTGNVIGYDNVSSESAIQTEVNLQEITGGFGNPVVGIIPDSTRMTGTYTSAAFSLHTRQLISGGNLHYGGVSPVCETILADSTTLTVSKTPVKHYAQPASDTEAWCYIKPVGAANYYGTNYKLNMSTKQVLNFVATPATSYEVFYFVTDASAQVLELPDMFNPSVVTISQKYGVYSKQNNSISHGTLQGYLYVIIPRAILNGSAGVSANQTENATTEHSWMALSPDQNMMQCADCANSTKVFAYYVYVPCGGETAAVANLAVIGSGVSVVENGNSKQIPVVYIMPDGSTQTPTYSQLTYAIGGTAATASVPASDTYAQVTASGQISGLAAGDTEVRITLTVNGTTLETRCNVYVTAAL